MTLYVKRPVIIKNIVTENFKRQMIEELGNRIKQLEIRLEQMEFQERRMLADLGRKNNRQVSGLRENLAQERERQQQLKTNLEDRLAELEKLQVGDFYISGMYESPVKIDIGDNILERLSQAEIVVREGIVEQIIE